MKEGIESVVALRLVRPVQCHSVLLDVINLETISAELAVRQAQLIGGYVGRRAVSHTPGFMLVKTTMVLPSTIDVNRLISSDAGQR